VNSPYKSQKNNEGSQLSLWQRATLLIQNPRDAFSLFSSSERQSTAHIIFLLYFLVKLPIIMQKPALLGKLKSLEPLQSLLFIVSVLVAGMLLTILFLKLIALVMNFFINKGNSINYSTEDSYILLLLSLAPQLLLVYELPFLLADYKSPDTYLSALMLRLVVDLVSLRTFYWGLRILFNISKLRAIAIISLPSGTLCLGLLKLILG